RIEHSPNTTSPSSPTTASAPSVMPQPQQAQHSIHLHSPGLLPVQQQAPPHPHAVNAPPPALN
ncbi:4149_t:CDS:1, partial [Paraglomus occultum]